MWDLPEAEPEGPALAVVRHSILNRRLVLSVHGGRPLGEGKWFIPRRAAALPLAAAARKCLERLGFLNDK